MQEVQTIRPLRLNTDSDAGLISSEEAYFLLNHDSDVENGVFHPKPANYPVAEIDLPLGENHCIGSVYSPVTKESYYFVCNSNSNDLIYRVTENGDTDIIYYGNLGFSFDPERAITEFRAKLWINRQCNKVPGGILKELIFTDGAGNIKCIDTEASKNTDSFGTSFFDVCRDDEAFVTLALPDVNNAMIGDYIPRTPSDAGRPNDIVGRPLKLMYLHEYYDMRRTEWSGMSTMFYQSSKGCFDSDSFYPRGIRFTIPIGNPMVEKIHIAVSEDGGKTFFHYETIEKYKPYSSNSEYWYERKFREDFVYDPATCTFKYDFYNNRQKTTLAVGDVTRVVNPVPRDVQAIIEMPQGGMGFLNYVDGNCPLEKHEVEKLKITTTCTEAAECTPEMVEVVVRAVIYNFSMKSHGQMPIWTIYRAQGGGTAADDPNDTAMFGFPSSGLIHGQRFYGDRRNFLGYIKGTDITSEFKQYKSPTNKISDGVEVGVLSQETFVTPIEILGMLKRFVYQQTSFFVPKGTRGFICLGSHLNTEATGQFQNQSTQVKGITDIKNYQGGGNLSNFRADVHEIEFDTSTVTGGVLDLNDAFVIEDLGANDNKSTAFNGYITDNNDRPVEGAHIWAAPGGFQTITDHNGFYSFYNFDGDTSKTIEVEVETGCTGFFQTVGTFTATCAKGDVAYTDYKIQSAIYNDKFIQRVTCRAVDCSGLSVAGIRFAISGGRYAVTDDNGVAYFDVHNYNSRDRKVTIILMDGNGCLTKDCNGNCNFPFPKVIKSLPSCFLNAPEINAGSFTINTDSIEAVHGLKSGGRYPYGIVAKGRFGRISAAYLSGYLDVDSIRCSLNFNLNGMKLPEWVNSVSIVRGENVNGFRLQWIVDDVKTGGDNTIRLEVQSLNDYNVRYNFNANVNYQYQDGDRIKIVKNGDGSLLGAADFEILSPFGTEIVEGEANTANAANEIVLADTVDTRKIKKGAIFEVYYNKAVNDDMALYEVSAGIPVVNGTPVILSGTIDTFDTFLVRRKIGDFPSSEFEHWAPSDFYKGIINDDRGKAYFINEYENESRKPRNITLNNANQINRFGDYVKTFKMAAHGGIVGAGVKDETIGMVVSEHGNSTFSISDNYLRVDKDGNVVAGAADEIIGNLQPKIRGEYGCRYEDIGSICFADGFVAWVDKGLLIGSDYNSTFVAGAVEKDGDIQYTGNNFFKDKWAKRIASDSVAQSGLDKTRIVTGIDKTRNDIYVTFRRLRDTAVVNSSTEYANTIVYNYVSNYFKTMVSFAPECYSSMQLNTSDGTSVISINNAIPYNHPLVSERANEFYGIPCDWIIGVVLNQEPGVTKIPINIEQRSTTGWFAEHVYTDINMESYIPASYLENQEGDRWTIGFLGNINSGGSIFDDEQLKGNYIKVLLIRDNTVDLGYKTTDNEKRVRDSRLIFVNLKYIKY